MLTTLRPFLRSFLVLAGLAAIATANGPAPARAFDVQAVVGEWIPPDMDAIISIRPCGDSLCAELIKHAYGHLSDHDVLNPDPTLRQRPLVGLRILQGLRKAGETRWRGGQLYDPRTGKSYTPKLKIIDNQRLRISGCIGPGLCKGYVWKRVTKDITLREGIVQTSPSAVSESS